METRYIADCRKFEGNCSLTIAGTKDEVVPVAMQHAIDRHGHEETEELRHQIENMLEEERPTVAMVA